MLQDDLVSTATREIIADGTKARVTLNRESKEKVSYLCLTRVG